MRNVADLDGNYHKLHEPGTAVRNVADLDGNYHQLHEPGTAVRNVADLDETTTNCMNLVLL